MFLIHSSKCHCLSRLPLWYATLDKKESRESPGASWGLRCFFMGVRSEDGVTNFMDFLIELAVFAGIGIVVSVIAIIAIIWAHKY